MSCSARLVPAAEVQAAAGGVAGTVKPIQADEVALLLAYAQRVVIVPGYGMAVAQAQHSVRELSDELGKRGVEVQFAIHPVAGRMPGHMNVLLAEANVPYDQLIEMEQINPSMDRVDVCLVIGANDVVNPAAREEKTSPIYGMPIIEADRCKTVHRDETLDGRRFRRHRKPSVLQGQHPDAVRRRESFFERARRGGQGELSLPELVKRKSGLILTSFPSISAKRSVSNDFSF